MWKSVYESRANGRQSNYEIKALSPAERIDETYSLRETRPTKHDVNDIEPDILVMLEWFSFFYQKY